MALSFYDDDGGESTNENPPQDGSQNGEDTKTALIDSSICPGMKPGDTISLKIEKVLDDGEYAVSYMPEEKEESMEEPPMEESMAPQSEVASYME